MKTKDLSIEEREKRLNYNLYHREYYHRKKQEKLAQVNALTDKKINDLKGEQK